MDLPVMAQPLAHTKDEALNLLHKDVCGQASSEQLHAYKHDCCRSQQVVLKKLQTMAASVMGNHRSGSK